MGTVDIIILALFFGGCIALIVVGTRNYNAYRRKRRNDMEQYEASFYGLMKHVEGLPLVNGIVVELFYGRNKITIKKEQQEFTLECSRIISMDTCTGKNAMSQAASGAIAGRLILGGAGGAAIGALAATSIYLVIAYKKDNENKFILLDTAGHGALASKIIKDFKRNNLRTTEIVEL